MEKFDINKEMAKLEGLSQMVKMRKRMISPSKYRQVWKIDFI